MMIWSDEQRALGELMIVEQHGKVLCMGDAQHLLCELVETLDAHRVRYTRDLSRA